MSDATILPSYANNKFFFWNTYLTNSLDNSILATTIEWGAIPEDVSGQVTGAFLIAVKNVRRNPNRIELMWVPASSVSADGLSATVVRGLDPSGLDYTTGSADYVYDFDAGDEVFCAILPQDGELFRAVMQGLIGTGGNQFMLGDETAGVKTYGVYTNQGFKGIIRSTGALTEWSNGDGVWTAIQDTSASVVVKVSASDTTASYLNNKIDVATDGELTKAIGNAAGNETLQLGLATTLTKAEMDQLAGISANVTSTNLNTLNAGIASNADALHTHVITQVFPYTAYESISDNNALALLPIETQWYSQLTDTSVNIGSSNTLRKRAVKYIPTVTGTLTDWNFRAAEQVNGATTLGNLVITIETDSGGSPSGTVLTNATATISQATQRTWNTTIATRTGTFAGSVSFTAGTTYWVVYSVSATDATNYLKFGANDTYVGNYLTFTSKVYNLDTATWGTTSTTSIPFGWSNTTAVPFGYAVCPTDANFGGRTWNFIGFAAAAAAAQASVSVETEVAGLTGLLTNRKPYYLSETPGAITQSPTGSAYQEGTAPSSYIYMIGTALSSTSLKIRVGAKRIFIRESTQITATTTRQYILWFRPDVLRVYAGGLQNSGASEGGVSYGYDQWGSTGSAALTVGPTTGGSGTGATQSLNTGGGNFTSFVGTASYTDIGVTYTYTETGTANLGATIEAQAD